MIVNISCEAAARSRRANGPAARLVQVSIGPGRVPPAWAAPATRVKRLLKLLYFTCTNKKDRTSQINERKRNQ